jgi:hypothetical protein
MNRPAVSKADGSEQFPFFRSMNTIESVNQVSPVSCQSGAVNQWSAGLVHPSFFRFTFVP